MILVPAICCIASFLSPQEQPVYDSRPLRLRAVVTRGSTSDTCFVTSRRTFAKRSCAGRTFSHGTTTDWAPVGSPGTERRVGATGQSERID